MKKFLSVLLIASSMLVLVACGGGAGTKDYNNLTDEEFEKLEQIDQSQIADVYANPDNYKGKRITLTGKVFGDPEQSDGKTAFQMYQDSNNYKNNTVIYTKTAMDIKNDDYVLIDAVVTGTYSGENAFGGAINALQVTAYKAEKTDYITAESPTLYTIDCNASKTQHKLTVTLEKFEFAEKETRMYIKVVNKSGYEASIYKYSIKIIQGSKQYEDQSNYSAHYPDIPSDIAKGVTAEGIIAFPQFDHTKEFKVIIKGSSDNYNIDIKDYEFTIKP